MDRLLELTLCDQFFNFPGRVLFDSQKLHVVQGLSGDPPAVFRCKQESVIVRQGGIRRNSEQVVPFIGFITGLFTELALSRLQSILLRYAPGSAEGMAVPGTFLRPLQRRLHSETHQDRDRIPFAYAASPIRDRRVLPQRLQRGVGIENAWPCERHDNDALYRHRLR